MEGKTNFSRRLKMMAWPDWPRPPIFYDSSTPLFDDSDWAESSGRYNYDSTAIQPPLDSHFIRPRYDHSTTYVTTV